MSAATGIGAVLAMPAVRLSAMALAGLMAIAALSNLAIGVTLGMRFDDGSLDGFAGEGSLPDGFVPPPGDYSWLAEDYEGPPPSYEGAEPCEDQCENSQSEPGEGGEPPSGGEPPPGGEPGGEPPPGGEPGGEPPPGGQQNGEFPKGATEGIRPGSGENSMGNVDPSDLNGLNGPDSGFLEGVGDALSNPMDPRSVLIFLAVIAGAVGAAVGIRYLVIWWKGRDADVMGRSAENGLPLRPRDVPQDPRLAVCVVFENVAVEGRRRGVDFRRQETPREFIRRAVSEGVLPRAASFQLTDLYEEARLSTHPVGPTRRTQAIDCLRRIKRSMSGTSSP